MTTPTSAGWYDDPDQADQLRYFDGVVWTKHTAARRTRELRPVNTPPVSTPPVVGMPGGTPGTVPPADPYGWRAPQPPPSDSGTGTGGAGPSPQPGPWGQPGPPAPGQPGQQQWGQQQWAPQQQWALAGPTTPDGVPLAGYWQRVGAYLLDIVIQSLITSILGGYFLYRAVRPWIDDFVTAVQTGDTSAMENLQTSLTSYLTGRDFLIFTTISFLVGLVYTVGFWTRFGATPGKMAMRISVRERERPGPLPLVVALRRYALSVVTGLIGLLPGGISLLGSVVSIADLLWPAWDPRRQALHDKIAGTNVVRGSQPRR